MLGCTGCMHVHVHVVCVGGGVWGLLDAWLYRVQTCTCSVCRGRGVGAARCLVVQGAYMYMYFIEG